MNLKLFRSLPVREQSLLIVGCLIDDENVQGVLASDMRQGEIFKELLSELLDLLRDLREITLLSILSALMIEVEPNSYV